MRVGFWFMANTNRSLEGFSNSLFVEVDGVLLEIQNSNYIPAKGRRPCDRPTLLTDEVCDRIGKQLARDRTHYWTQFVEA